MVGRWRSVAGERVEFAANKGLRALRRRGLQRQMSGRAILAFGSADCGTELVCTKPAVSGAVAAALAMTRRARDLLVDLRDLVVPARLRDADNRDQPFGSAAVTAQLVDIAVQDESHAADLWQMTGANSTTQRLLDRLH